MCLKLDFLALSLFCIMHHPTQLRTLHIPHSTFHIPITQVAAPRPPTAGCRPLPRRQPRPQCAPSPRAAPPTAATCGNCQQELPAASFYQNSLFATGLAPWRRACLCAEFPQHDADAAVEGTQVRCAGVHGLHGGGDAGVGRLDCGEPACARQQGAWFTCACTQIHCLCAATASLIPFSNVHSIYIVTGLHQV